MSKYCWVLPLFILLSSCEKDSKEALGKGCYISPEIENKYSGSIINMLYYQIWQDSAAHPDYHNPYFDTTDIHQLLEAFQAVHDLSIPESDTVFDIYKIPGRAWVSPNKFSMHLDASAPETQKILANQPTGNTTYDSLQAEFGIQFEESQNSGWHLFKTEDNYNLLPIMDALENLSFINRADVEWRIGDGSDIQFKMQGRSTRLTFSLRWGDCPSGCLHERNWVFDIDPECRARFVNSYGKAVP